MYRCLKKAQVSLVEQVRCGAVDDEVLRAAGTAVAAFMAVATSKG
jgi:hypothetical protein